MLLLFVTKHIRLHFKSHAAVLAFIWLVFGVSSNVCTPGSSVLEALATMTAGVSIRTGVRPCDKEHEAATVDVF